MKVLTGLIANIIVLSQLWAQPSFYKQRYTKDQGLSHNTVLNMKMDERGFLWISTLDGLNRFDGQSMKVFRHSEDDSTTISDSFIHGIYQHESGKLWVSTRDGGLNVYDPVTETFSLLSKKSTEFPDAAIKLNYKDQNGNFWFSFFGNSIGIFDEEKEKYYPVRIVDKRLNQEKESANSIIEFRDGSMLFGSFEGLFYVSSNEVKRFTDNPENTREIETSTIFFSPGNRVPNTNNLYIDSNNDIWAFLVSSGLQKLEKQQIPRALKKSLESGVAGNSAKELVVERGNYIISGHMFGELLFIDIETGEKITQSLDGKDELREATYIYADPNKGLWAYTWGGGFYKLKEKKGIKLFNSNTHPEEIKYNFMLAFENDEKGFWTGSASEVSFFDEKENSINQLNNRLDNDEINGVWSIDRNELGLWMATIEKGLVFIPNEELDKAKNLRVQRFNFENSLIKSEKLHQVFMDSRGWLWLGYEGEGVQVIKNPRQWVTGRPAQVLELNPEAEVEKNRISTDRIRVFYEDANHDIWLATLDSGFDRVQIRNGEVYSITNFSYDEENKNSIPHNDGRSIYQQNDSTYWFATYGGGIAKWNMHTSTFQRFTTEQGLPNNSTYSILPGSTNEFIWISTNSGLARLDISTGKFRVFTEEDGLQNNEFNTGAYLKKSDGKLVFGGINGFNIVNPAQIESNINIPPVYITEVELFNSPLKMDSSATDKGSVVLNYDQNFLAFEFAALDFENPAENQFAYKMLGVDEDWVYSGNRNFASYPNLRPGDYVFAVKGSNNDGVWNESGARLGITIFPPWWQTVWFRAISIGLLLAGFIFGIRYLSQRKLREQIRKMELENRLRSERERISRDLHDHVGSQLANIMSGLTLVDKYNQIDNKEKSSSLMNSLQGDAQVTIKQLRETIWALNQNDLTIGAFREYLQEYFNTQSALSETLVIRYSLNGDEKTPLSSTQALNLFRIIQEAAQNTLKYAEAENLEIILSQKKQELQVSISDDGIFKGNSSGFNEGYGMRNMQKRVDELGGKFEIEIQEGTKVKATIPL